MQTPTGPNTGNSRALETQQRRRRRSDQYRGYNLRLEVPEHLKDANYRYYWCNDEKGKLQYRTTQDDWDFVDGKELGIASHDDGAKDSNQTDGRIRRVVDSATSSRPVYAYLLKKRKDFDAADFREEMDRIKERRAGMIRTQRAGLAGPEDGEDARDFNERTFIPGEVKQAIDATEGRIRRAGGWPKGKPRGTKPRGSGGPFDSESGD